jgi:hypothetical protein
MRDGGGNQFWEKAARRAQPRGDRRNESRHNCFTQLCGSQAQNN